MVGQDTEIQFFKIIFNNIKYPLLERPIAFILPQTCQQANSLLKKLYQRLDTMRTLYNILSTVTTGISIVDLIGTDLT